MDDFRHILFILVHFENENELVIKLNDKTIFLFVVIHRLTSG